MWVLTPMIWCFPVSAAALQEVVPPGKETIAGLIVQLENKDRERRLSAVYEIRLRGKAAATAVPKLLELLHDDEDADVRMTVAYCLGEFGRENADVSRALIASLQKDSVAAVRSNSAIALGQLSQLREVALPALVRALEDGDGGTRGNAAIALGKLGPDEAATAALQKTLKNDKSVSVRVQVAISLLRDKPRDRTPFVAIIRAVKHEFQLDGADEDTKRANFIASQFVLGINSKSVAMIPALIDALGDEDSHIRHCAAYALGRIGPPAKSATAALKTARGDESSIVRESAARALAAIEAVERP